MEEEEEKVEEEEDREEANNTENVQAAPHLSPLVTVSDKSSVRGRNERNLRQ